MSIRSYLDRRTTHTPWAQTLPAHWSFVPLRYLVDCLDGQRIPLNAEERSLRQGDVPYWGAGSVVDHINEHLFDETLVLLGEDGAPFFDRTRPVAFFITGKVWPNNHIHVLRSGPSVDSKFLSYFLNAVDYADYVEGSTRDKLTQAAMNCIPIARPPLDEQRIIASFLDQETGKIDRLVGEQEHLIELLAEKRQAVIAHAVTKGLNPSARMKDSGVPWLGAVPAHWGVLPSRRLFGVRNERALPTDIQLTASQKYGVLPQSEFIEREGRRVVEVIKGTDSLLHVEPDDFIISMRSFQGGLEWCGLRGSTSFHYVMVVPRSLDRIHPPYFAHLFKSSTYIQALRSTTDLIRDGQEIRYSHFVQVPLPVVPLAEQKEIAAFVGREVAAIDELSSEASRAIELLKERRAALVAVAVTGQIDVRGAA